MITKRDIATFIATLFVTYVARDLGNVDVGKTICSFDVAMISTDIIVNNSKYISEQVQHPIEALFGSRFAGNALDTTAISSFLRGGGRFRETADDMFFAFSVSHLKPAFVVLTVGTVLSSVVFIAELILNCLGKRRKKKFFSHIYLLELY